MRNSSEPETMTSAPVVTPTERQNSVARESSARFWVGSFKSGGVSMTSSLVFLSTCFFRKRWNSPCRSTFWSRLSRAFSASVTRMKGASASLSFPRSGSRGFNGSFNRTWLTPAEAGATASRSARAATPAARSARNLASTGGFPGRPRIGGVELGEARVVPANVGIVRAKLQRFLVFGQGPREFSRGFQSDGEVVVGPGVAGLPGDGLLEPERGLAPQPLARDLGPEGDLGLGPFGPIVGGAARREEESCHCPSCPTHSHAPVPPAGVAIIGKLFQPGRFPRNW